MSFRRSIFRLAERNDVQPALKKLWKKYYKVDGQVTQHLSPFEQNIVTPMFKDIPAKVMKKLTEVLIEAGPGLFFGIGVYYWAEAKHKEIAFSHRS